MAKHNILTVQEVENFIDRLRATASAALDSHSLMEALSRLITGGASDGVRLPAASAPTGKTGGRSRGAATTNGRRGGRKARVADTEILEMLRKAGNGLQMRDLMKDLGQHMETIRLKLSALRKQSLVTTSGPRNQLRYHAAGTESATQPAQSAQSAPASDGGAKPRGRRGRPPGPGKSDKSDKSDKRGKSAGHGRGAAPALDGVEDKLLGLVRTAGAAGVAMGLLEDEIKQPAKALRKVIEKMRQNGQINVTGQRRSTRYHAGI